MKQILISFALLFSQVQAQVLRSSPAAQYAGFGAYSQQQADVFSFSSNKAALAELKNNAAGIYAERKFMLKELNQFTAAVVINSASGNFGLQARYAGFAGYNETGIGLAYARKLFEKFSIGAQMNYHAVRIGGNYGNASALSFDIGTLYHVSDKWHTGITISNPIGGKFGKSEEKLSSVYSFGLGYETSEKLVLSVVMEKEEDQPVNIHAGLQYRFIPQLMARAGIASVTSSVWLGLGYSFRSFRIDITSAYHPQLGITPGLLLLFSSDKSRR